MASKYKRQSPALLAAWLTLDVHLVMCLRGRLDHYRAELHHYQLGSETAGKAKLEDPRIGSGEPVILDQVLGHDVSRQHRRAAARRTGVAQGPFRDQWQIAGLGGEGFHPHSVSHL